MRLVTGRPAFSLCSSIHLSQCTEGEPSKPFMYSRHCPAQKLVRRPHLPWGNIQPPWGSTRCALGPGPHLPPPVLHSLRLYTPAQLKYFPLHHVPSSLAPGSEHMLAPSYRTLLFSPALPVWPLSSLRSESKCEFCQDSLTPSQDQMRAPLKLTHSPLGHSHRSESHAVVSLLSFASPGHAWHQMEVQYTEEGWHAHVYQLRDVFTFAGTLAAAWRHWDSFFLAWSGPIHISV